MFQRDSDESDPAFAWPPGFRERRSTNLSSGAEPDTASASSTSTPLFRQNPHFAAHRKSSDQVIQQLRDELDRQRQMFFDRLAPQWDQRASGFPFSDGVRRVFTDASERAMPHRAHHEHDIPSWMTEDDHQHQPEAAFSRRQRWPSGGSARSSASSASSAGGGPAPDGGGPNEPERSDSPGRPRIHKPATRSATGDFPAAASPGSPKTFNRAGSAPPQSEPAPSTSQSTGVPRRGFVVTQQQPVNQTDSPGARRRAAQQQQQQASNGGHVVRHIPIVVEGRDEPLLPSVAEEEQQAAEKRSKTAIPMPFYPSSEAALQSKANESDASSGTSAPKQAKVNQKEEERDGTIPIPLPYDRLSDGVSNASPTSQQAEQRTAADLEQISRIQRETEALLPRVESFSGDRHHRDFLYLDEMLTRLLLKLDNVQVEGREDVRQARRQAIASITRCINLLESRLLDSIDRSSQEPDSSAPAAASGGALPDEVAAEDAGREVEQERDAVPAAEETAPVAPPPVTHVTQLVINIGAPAREEPGSGEPVQEVN